MTTPLEEAVGLGYDPSQGLLADPELLTDERLTAVFAVWKLTYDHGTGYDVVISLDNADADDCDAATALIPLGAIWVSMRQNDLTRVRTTRFFTFD